MLGNCTCRETRRSTQGQPQVEPPVNPQPSTSDAKYDLRCSRNDGLKGKVQGSLLEMRGQSSRRVASNEAGSEEEGEEGEKEDMDMTSGSSSSRDHRQEELEHSEDETAEQQVDTNNDDDDLWEEGQGDLNVDPGSSSACLSVMTPVKVWVSANCVGSIRAQRVRVQCKGTV